MHVERTFKPRWTKSDDRYYLDMAVIVGGVILEGASAIVFPQEDGTYIGRLSFAENKHLDEDFKADTAQQAKRAVSKRIKAVFSHLKDNSQAE